MIETPEFWYKKNISSKVKIFLIFPFSIIWILISYIKKSFIKKYKSNLKVICIGNLTIGGTGKTPFAIYIYKILKNFGYKPVFLTRGYKGLLKGPVEVKDTHNFETVGDEAMLLSKIGPTIVSKDRSLGARLIENHEENFNIIIMAKDSLSTFDESLIRTLASILEETGLSEIEYSKEGVKARVVKAYGGQVQVASSQPKPSQEPVIENTATVDQGTITAPMVGVVYIFF